MSDLALQAFYFGLLSAVSLPLGAVLAGFWTPGPRLVAALMAFGGGALLAALTIDLVAESLRQGHFYPLAIGCIVGGILYVILNQTVNNRGGFLRKAATTVNHLRRQKLKQFRQLSRRLGQSPVFQNLPPEEIKALLPYVNSVAYKAGTILMKQGDPGDSMFIIEHGTVQILDTAHDDHLIATLTGHDIVGEMALLTGQPRSATALAVTDVRLWVIVKEHFDYLMHMSPTLAAAVTKIVEDRIQDLSERKSIDSDVAQDWTRRMNRHMEKFVSLPSEVDIKHAASTHGGAPLAIWLGILLDGIPESLVIGSSMLHASISFSLIAGLFLSNFPEALSSSVGMRQQGYSKIKVLIMWGSLMIITGIGAFFGNIFFVEAPHWLFVIVEGTAAGAMLTMIAETMLPEAYHKGGAITGFSTLMGFLAAIFFKTLEQ